MSDTEGVRFTERESQILQVMREGWVNSREIAAEMNRRFSLDISPRTVEAHINRIAIKVRSKHGAMKGVLSYLLRN